MSTTIANACIALVALLLSIYNTAKRDTKEDMHRITKVMTKLDSISEDIREMKKDLSDMRTSIQDNHDRIIRAEMSLEAVWKTIGEMKNE